MRFTNEFKVGVLTLLVGAFIALFIQRTDDRPDGAVEGYVLYALVPTAEGVQVSTQVLIAGVSVGSVRRIELEGPEAKLTLEMSGQVKLPTDSYAEMHGTSVLGDKTVVIQPGTGAELLVDGDTIETRRFGPDIDALSAQVETITADVQAITASLREVLDDPEFKASLTATVQNLEELSKTVKDISTANSAQISVIAENLRVVTESLKELLNTTGGAIDSQMAIIEQATLKLDASLADINSITSKIDAGEGTLGYLLNDDTPAQQLELTLSQVNTTLDEVNDLVGSVSDLQTDIYYDGAVLLGTQPDASFGDNPYDGQTRNALGLEIRPRDDYWYIVEIVDHPLGSFDFRQVESPELGTVYTEYVRTRATRVSFQFARRYDNVVLRFGLKDSSGGVGADLLLLSDRLKLSADLYDFDYGSYPVLDGTPNLKLGLQLEPRPHIVVQAGLYNTLVGAKYGFATGYIGGGFHFTDDDFKWIVASLPSL